jgi:hypothetical protein
MRVALALIEVAALLFVSLVCLLPRDSLSLGGCIVATLGVIVAVGHIVAYAIVSVCSQQHGQSDVTRRDTVRVIFGSAGTLTAFGLLMVGSSF